MADWSQIFEATSDEEKVTAGYLINNICNDLADNPHDFTDVADYLASLIDGRNLNVKLKALLLVKHISSRIKDFADEIRRYHFDCIESTAQLSGPPSQLYGDEAYEMLRGTARQVMEILEESKNICANSSDEHFRDRIVGFSSDDFKQNIQNTNSNNSAEARDNNNRNDFFGGTERESDIDKGGIENTNNRNDSNNSCYTSLSSSQYSKSNSSFSSSCLACPPSTLSVAHSSSSFSSSFPSFSCFSSMRLAHNLNAASNVYNNSNGCSNPNTNICINSNTINSNMNNSHLTNTSGITSSLRSSSFSSSSSSSSSSPPSPSSSSSSSSSAASARRHHNDDIFSLVSKRFLSVIGVKHPSSQALVMRDFTQLRPQTNETNVNASNISHVHTPTRMYVPPELTPPNAEEEKKEEENVRSEGSVNHMYNICSNRNNNIGNQANFLPFSAVSFSSSSSYLNPCIKSNLNANLNNNSNNNSLNQSSVSAASFASSSPSISSFSPPLSSSVSSSGGRFFSFFGKSNNASQDANKSLSTSSSSSSSSSSSAPPSPPSSSSFLPNDNVNTGISIRVISSPSPLPSTFSVSRFLPNPSSHKRKKEKEFHCEGYSEEGEDDEEEESEEENDEEEADEEEEDADQPGILSTVTNAADWLLDWLGSTPYPKTRADKRFYHANGGGGSTSDPYERYPVAHGAEDESNRGTYKPPVLLSPPEEASSSDKSVLSECAEHSSSVVIHSTCDLHSSSASSSSCSPSSSLVVSGSSSFSCSTSSSSSLSSSSSSNRGVFPSPFPSSSLSPSSYPRPPPLPRPPPHPVPSDSSYSSSLLSSLRSASSSSFRSSSSSLSSSCLTLSSYNSSSCGSSSASISLGTNSNTSSSSLPLPLDEERKKNDTNAANKELTKGNMEQQQIKIGRKDAAPPNRISSSENDSTEDMHEQKHSTQHADDTTSLYNNCIHEINSARHNADKNNKKDGHNETLGGQNTQFDEQKTEKENIDAIDDAVKVGEDNDEKIIVKKEETQNGKEEATGKEKEKLQELDHKKKKEKKTKEKQIDDDGDGKNQNALDLSEDKEEQKEERKNEEVEQEEEEKGVVYDDEEREHMYDDDDNNKQEVCEVLNKNGLDESNNSVGKCTSNTHKVALASVSNSTIPSTSIVNNNDTCTLIPSKIEQGENCGNNNSDGNVEISSSNIDGASTA